HSGFHYGRASLDYVQMAWGYFVGDDGLTTHTVFYVALSIPEVACLSQSISGADTALYRCVSWLAMAGFTILVVKIDPYHDNALLDYVPKAWISFVGDDPFAAFVHL
ncbi:hypothetical protein Tco_1258518, partial [Tanacetum coccineum]